MKLITLNTWGGRMSDRLPDFFNNYKDTNIWCFQEVYKKSDHAERVEVPGYQADFDLQNKIENYLNSHKSEFCQTLDNYYGIATFVEKDVKIIDRGEMLVASGNRWNSNDLKNGDHHRKLQWLEIEITGKRMIIANVHLTHRPKGKTDSDKRLNQSRIIIDFLKMFDCPKILVGDFNLLPGTESIKMIEGSGMINLIKKFNIQSTRTEIYISPLRFADYIFVSPEITVKDFQVLPDVVSDHSPLYLDFEI